ncbi:hypothetical protein D3C72_2013910 [compost metagenome]
MSVASGSMVLMSIRMVPGLALANMPSAANASCSTSTDEGSMVTTMAQSRAISATDAGSAPMAVRSFTAVWFRSWTFSANPFFTKLAAMDLPMRPKPIKPILSAIVYLLVAMGG